ncbi:MAG: hypothetical protein J6328_02415 [Bacilli bacterium]|nr:hypothetical protein [Bacilli bacterium]
MVKDLSSFLSLREAGRVDLSEFDGALSLLPLSRLSNLFSPFIMLRLSYARKWASSLGASLGRRVILLIKGGIAKPYMDEKGVIILPRSVIWQKDLLYVSLLHESAHFILAASKDYETLRMLDKEYSKTQPSDMAMRSPIELYANALTIEMMKESLNGCVGEKRRRRIERIIHELETQSIQMGVKRQ